MNLDASKCLGRHEFAQAEELPSVGGEDGDLGGAILLAQEVLAQLHHKVCLVLVLMAFAFLDLLLRKAVLHKVKVGGDPLRSKATRQSVLVVPPLPFSTRTKLRASHMLSRWCTLSYTPALGSHLKDTNHWPSEETAFCTLYLTTFTSEVSHQGTELENEKACLSFPSI